jgi:hypothetical protein
MAGSIPDKHGQTQTLMKPSKPCGTMLKIIALLLGLGLGPVGASAQTILEVGGGGVISTQTLISNDLAATGATFSTKGGTATAQSHLISPAITVPTNGNVTLRFSHRYDFEDHWDGGAVFVSINGSEASYVPASAFSANAYDGDTQVTGSSAWPGGEQVFTLASAGYAQSSFVESVVDLGHLDANDSVSVEFRSWWGSATPGPTPNWEIATVTLEDSASTVMLEVDFVADGKSGFTVDDFGNVAGPWAYHAPRHTFELDAVAKTADRYAPVAAGNAINLNGADLVVEVQTGDLEVGDTFSFFDLSGGTTLTGSLGSISLPGGAAWDVSNLAAGGDGTITLLRFAGFQLLQRDIIGGSAGNLSNTTQAEAVLALEAPNSQYDYIDTQVLRNTINVAGSGSFGGTDPLPDGLAHSDTYVLHARTHLVIPPGEWTIGFGSDDGGSLTLGDVEFLTKTNSIGGANELRFWGTRAHNWTFGTFTLTKPLVTSLDAVMFEGTGADSWEIAIFEGHATGFDPETWVLLEDAAKGWRVVWADVLAPVIISTIPADDTVGAAVFSELTANFNEQILLTGHGTVTIKHLDGGSDITIPLPDSRVKVAGRTLSIDPGTNLDFDADYAVLLSADAITSTPNPQPNAFPGIDETSFWNFSTVAQDTTPPTLVSVNPAGTLVLPNTTLTITFDDDILPGAANPLSDLLNENFDQGAGGFIVTQAIGNAWEHGFPDSSGPRGKVMSDNGGSGQCWGTNLGDFSGSGDPGFYNNMETLTRFRSPVIDLAGVEFARVSFAEAKDVWGDYTNFGFRIIDADTNTSLQIFPSDDEDSSSAFWTPVVLHRKPFIDLTSYSGRKIQLEWYLLGYGISPPENGRLGYYIDDVTVVEIARSTSIVLDNLGAGTDIAIPMSDGDRISFNGNVMTIRGLRLDPNANYAVRIGSEAIRNCSDVPFPGHSDSTTWTFATENATTLLVDGTWHGDKWLHGPPAGSLNAIIASGVEARIDQSGYAPWGGKLVLEQGASLVAPFGDVLIFATEFIMNDGSFIHDCFSSSGATWTFDGTFSISGKAGLACTSQTGTGQNRVFNGEISGDTWVTDGRTNQGFTYNVANSFAAYEVRSSTSQRHGVAFNAPGAGGLGDVTVSGGNQSAVIILGSDDVFSDTCVLTLNGKGWNGTTPSDGEAGPYATGPWVGTRMRLFMDHHDATVSELWIDGIQRAARDYTGADAEWIGGEGTLTVLHGPNDSVPPTLSSVDIVDDVNGGPIFESGTVTYTVTFSEPVDDLTVDVGDFENGGTAPVTIDSTSTDIHTGQVTVVVASLSPGGAGTLNLRLASGADIRDFAGNPVDPATGVDDTIITIIADVTPPVVAGLWPPSGETGVSAQPDLVIDFLDETGIQRGNGIIEIRDRQDDSVIQSYDVATAQEIAFIGKFQLVIDLNASLGFGREVYVHIPPGAFKDFSDNDFPGFTSPADWSFTTGIVPPQAGPLSLFHASVAGEPVTTTKFLHTFDTVPRLSVSHDLEGASDIRLTAGRHLVIYNSRFDSSGGADRSVIQTHLNLAGSDLASGWSQGHIRRFGSYEAITAGGAIIQADDGEILRLQSFRSDTNTGAGVVRADHVTNSTSAHGDPGPVPGETGSTALQLLKLGDDWPCLRMVARAASSPNPIQQIRTTANYNEVIYNVTLERSIEVFGYENVDIDLNETGHYLVLANTFVNGAGLYDRESFSQYLTLDDIEVPGSRTNVYLRTADGAFEGAASLGMIIRADAGQVLNVRIITDGSSGGAVMDGTRSALNIVKLPANAEILRLTDATGQNINATASLHYGTRSGGLPGIFSHDPSSNSNRIGVNAAGDYLFLATHYVPAGDSSNQRRLANQGWRINGTGGFSPFGQTGRYNRHSPKTRYAGNWSGFMAGLAPGDYVETVTQPLGNGGADSANLALQVVSIDSLFAVTPPQSNFIDWIALHPGVGAHDGFEHDPDGDGNANGIENYFGSDPSVFSAGIGEVHVTGNTVTFRHPLNANPAVDINAAYLWSDDLLSFHADGADNGSGTTVSFVQGPPSGGMVEVTATISGPIPAKLFIAIKVTQGTP